MTSVWTAFLFEILSASILHKLQQVCCMKRKTKEMILATWVWESKSTTFYFLSTNCSNCWVKINNSKGKNFWPCMRVHHQPVNCRICKPYLSATVCKHKCRCPFCLHTGFYHIRAKSPTMITWYYMIHENHSISWQIDSVWEKWSTENNVPSFQTLAYTGMWKHLHSKFEDFLVLVPWNFYLKSRHFFYKCSAST